MLLFSLVFQFANCSFPFLIRHDHDGAIAQALQLGIIPWMSGFSSSNLIKKITPKNDDRGDFFG